MTASRPGHGPLSRPVVVADIPAGGLDVTVEASEAERKALAADFRLPAILSLVGRFAVRPTAIGAHVTGSVAARVVQTCVVSLESFEAGIDEPVDVEFAPADADEEAEIDVSPDHDPPDPIVDGRIDLGALTAEFLALALDPYPRKPDTAFASHVEAEAAQSPFAALAGRRSNPQNEQ